MITASTGKLVYAIAMCGLLAACAAKPLAEWRDSNYSGTVDNILIIGVSDQPVVRPLLAGAEHDHQIVADQLGMGDAAAFVRHHQVAGEAEGVAGGLGSALCRQWWRRHPPGVGLDPRSPVRKEG